MKLKIIYLSLFIIFLFGFNNSAFAQVDSSGTAISSPVNDPDAVNGDLVCTSKEGNKRCNEEYALSIFGVISENSALELEDLELKDSRLVITSGIASVRVSTVNGNIKEGDFITTSAKAGVGEKATRNGYVVGAAMENYEAESADTIGSIQVLINIHPDSKISGTGGNLLQFIRSGLAVPVLEPLEALRYLLAIAMVLISFTFGMIYFGRASRAGIEAIGRNPLAKKVIQLTVVLNVVLTIVIVAIGLGIAYLILVL